MQQCIEALSPVLVTLIICVTVIIVTWKGRGRISSVDFSKDRFQLKFFKKDQDNSASD